MAVRSATLDLSDFSHFVREARGSLASGAALLPAGTVDGELAAEFRLDLLLPLVGRFGPLKAQVIQRMPDGGVAARLPEQGKLKEGIDRVWKSLDTIQEFLVAEGRVELPGQTRHLDETIDEEALVEDTLSEELDEEELDDDASYDEEVVDEDDEVVHEGGLRAGYALPPGLDAEPDAAGSCEDRSLRDFLVDAAMAEQTGILSLLMPDGTKRFGFWLNGGPVGFRHDPLDIGETVGGLLVKSGRLDEEQRLKSVQVMEQEGCRQGEALVKMGVLGQGSIGALLRKQVEFLLQSTLRQREGVWAFHTIEQHVEAFAIEPLGVPFVLYKAMLDFSKNVSSEQVYARLKSRLDARISLVPSVEPVLRSFEFNEREERFLRLLRADPSYRVRKVFSLTPLTKADTAGTIWALEEMGMVSFGAEEDAESQTRLRRLAAPLMKKARAVESSNLFDVLEIHWICTPAEVQSAYDGLSRRWSRAALGSLSGELGDALQTIEARLSEARDTLADAERRRAYRQEVVGDEMVSKCAAFLATKGDRFIYDDDRPMAIRCFSRATELEPANGDFAEGLRKAEALKRKFKNR